jgi:putative colanic acid biosynthesis acetyltransferase WcaF
MQMQEKSAANQFRLDIAGNRRARKWSAGEMLGRACWEILRNPLFAWTPRPLWAWRRTVLRLFGATIGRDVNVHPAVRIEIPWNLSIDDNTAVGNGAILYSLGKISIGRDVTISQYAHLCAGTHDYRSSDMPLMKTPIQIGEGAWLCADSFIGPGVNVGSFAVVAARAVSVRDVDPWSIVGGNPARPIGRRPHLIPVATSA